MVDCRIKLQIMLTLIFFIVFTGCEYKITETKDDPKPDNNIVSADYPGLIGAW